jgi:hypothetical protein
MKLRSILLLAIPLLTGGVAYIVSCGYAHRALSAMYSSDPILDCPREVDLGEQELGAEAVARFSIANRGRSTLVIDHVQTNCSCAGLERENEGRFYRFESLEIKPGEAIPLVMRLSVRGVPPGARMLTRLRFYSNDPHQPEWEISAIASRVTAGVSLSPSALILGNIPLHAEIHRIVDVRDASVSPRTIQSVTSSGSKHILARLMTPTETPDQPNRNTNGTLIGRIEVEISSNSPGDLHGSIEVGLAGESRQPDALDVIGRVVAPAEMRPSMLSLPISSQSGPIYSAQSICRSTDGSPIRVKVDAVPPGLKVEILPQDKAECKQIKVTLDKNRFKSPSSENLSVKLKVEVNGKESQESLPVLVRISER